MVDAGVDHGPSRVESNLVEFDIRGVDLESTNLVTLLEDHHAVALAKELSSSYETCSASADDCNVA